MLFDNSSIVALDLCWIEGKGKKELKCDTFIRTGMFVVVVVVFWMFEAKFKSQ